MPSDLSKEAGQMGQKTATAAQGRGFKEFIRKFIVSLKRSPQRIPLVALLAAFLIYSLNLSAIANTTAKINSANMGQCEFVAMLFSILAFVCFLRAFPKREKPKMVMLAVMFVMMVGMIFADCIYYSRVIDAVTRTENRIAVTAETAYIAVAQNIVIAHIICLAITMLLLVTLPLYAKALKNINTSIDVEDNGEMDAIDISGEE